MKRHGPGWLPGWLIVALGAWGLTALAAAQTPATNPLSGDPTAIRQGRSSFRNFCSNCHGGKADGRGERGQGANLRVFKKGFRKYVQVVKEGREVKGRIQNMPAWGKVLPEKDIYQIGAYLETLAKEGANWGDVQP